MEGVTRGSEKRSVFVPDNNPAKGEWFWIDVPALAVAAGLPPETPLVEVSIFACIIMSWLTITDNHAHTVGRLQDTCPHEACMPALAGGERQ